MHNVLWGQLPCAKTLGSSQGFWRKKPHGSQMIRLITFTSEEQTRRSFYMFRGQGMPRVQMAPPFSLWCQEFWWVTDCSKSNRHFHSLRWQKPRMAIEIAAPTSSVRSLVTSWPQPRLEKLIELENRDKRFHISGRVAMRTMVQMSLSPSSGLRFRKGAAGWCFLWVSTEPVADNGCSSAFK